MAEEEERSFIFFNDNAYTNNRKIFPVPPSSYPIPSTLPSRPMVTTRRRDGLGKRGGWDGRKKRLTATYPPTILVIPSQLSRKICWRIG